MGLGGDGWELQTGFDVVVGWVLGEIVRDFGLLAMVVMMGVFVGGSLLLIDCFDVMSVGVFSCDVVVDVDEAEELKRS